jgi:hypothetical protein
MSSKRAKQGAIQGAKEKREKGAFLALPQVVLESEEFASLSPYALKLLFDMASQWRFGSNGYQSATWSLMEKRGWKSKATLAKALKELEDNGWLIRTRQGGRNQCSLFAFSFMAIDQHKAGKPLEVRPTSVPLSYWNKKWCAINA